MTATRVRPPGSVRLDTLDRVRGLAIVLMLVDHLAYLGGVVELRLTVGRLAMPLFFLLAGGLVRRWGSRHALALGLGLLLPLVAPWAGAPNVLVVFAVGAALLLLCERSGLPVPLLVLISLVAAANRWEVGTSSYDPAALIAIMALGRLIGTDWAVRLGDRLPAWLAGLGRRPLLWYVGNVVLIQAVILWLSRA